MLKLGSNGLLASGSRDGLVCVWNIRIGQPLHQFNIHAGGVYFSAALLNDDFLAMAEHEGDIFVRELCTGVCHLLQGHTEYADFATPANGRFASYDSHGNVRIWSCNTWTCEVALSGVLPGVDNSALFGSLAFTQQQIYAPWEYSVYTHDLQTHERRVINDIDLVDPNILAGLGRAGLWCCETEYEGNWIKYGGQRLLCLPDYGFIVDCPVYGNTLAVGYGNGRIILIRFDGDKKPSAFASTSHLREDDTVTLS